MSNWRSVDSIVLLRVAALLIGSAALVGCGQGEHAPDHSGHEEMTGMDMPGMNMAATTKAGLADTSLDAALRSPNAFVIADVESVTMQQEELPKDLEASGVIAYDPRSIRTISARAAGWIDKLYVKYRYQPVQQGQPLMSLYSRELVTEQENYLFLTRQEPKDPVMVSAAEKRLTLLGLTEDQIVELRNTGAVKRAVTYFSPAGGHLHESDRTEPTAPAGSMPMLEESSERLLLREGAYVEKGQTLFTIYGTRTLLALLNVRPEDAQDQITTGERVSIHLDGDTGLTMNGHVDLVEPVYREGASFMAVRVYLPNTGDSLPVGTRVTANIHMEPQSAWTVPSSAVVSTGLRQYVFVKGSGGYRARMVSTGRRSLDRIEVRSGIGPHDAIARNGQLLIDSESFLKATSP